MTVASELASDGTPQAGRRPGDHYHFGFCGLVHRSGPKGMRRPRSTAIDSGTIAATGDGSTAPSGILDGSANAQVGEQRLKLL